MGGRALGGLAEPRDGGFVLRNRWGPQGLGRGRRRTTEPRGARMWPEERSRHGDLHSWRSLPRPTPGQRGQPLLSDGAGGAVMAPLFSTETGEGRVIFPACNSPRSKGCSVRA